MKKVALHNLGCKVNSYETEAMQQMLERAGYEIVPFSEGADIYIINTCSVTNIADRKSRQMLHRARKQNPDAIVVAAGCYVQAAKEQVEADEAIDIVIGNNKKADLIQILREFEEHRGEGQKAEAVIDIAHTSEYEALSVDRIGEHTRAFIKVQDGCNQFCSYCIIPYTRGRVRSRGLLDIVEETKRLAAAGYKEIVLTGIHLSSYGMDFPEGKKETLLSLIKALHPVEGIARIRLGSLEPRIVTEEFVRELSGMEKICPHFHLSLQSGCGETLKRMNRHYTPKEYLAGCELLRRFFEDPAITTDVIVGFPGETKEEFAETVEFLKAVHFYEMHVFKYSKRAGTRAAVMENQVPEPVKAKRSDVLLELEERMSEEYRKRLVGKTVEVLFEEDVMVKDGEEEKVYHIGHTKEYVKVGVAADAGVKSGEIRSVLVKMIGEKRDVVVGELV